MTTDEAIETSTPAPRRRRRMGPFSLPMLLGVIALLFGVPLWTLFFDGTGWPLAVRLVGTVAIIGWAAAFPYLMAIGHGKRNDRAAILGDTTLGVVWILFVWSIIANVLGLILLIAGVHNPDRGRLVAAFALLVGVVLIAWGYVEAMRVPRIRRVPVTIERLGAGLDGLRVVLITDTHYGPLDRARWSRGLAAAVNTLDADVLCHTGDIADGTPEERREQAAPLATMRAGLARTYVTGNHEYFNEAQGWLDHMAELGWEPLHNRHVTVERGGDRLVIAGIDDRTAEGSGKPGHGADLAAALADVDKSLPVLLLAHQPKQVDQAVALGVDLQISGHTHGGQIWPFHYLVLTDQPALAGLSRHGARTQLYTSRGSGFWGPPFRVFAPSEITLITLHAGKGA
jgi:uncharacterized protein